MSLARSDNNDASRNPSAGKPSLRQRMSRDLQLRGMAKRTHDGYLREVRKLACFYNAPPDQLTEQQVGEYLLYLINDCNFAPGTLGVAYSGIKFFYTFAYPYRRREHSDDPLAKSLARRVPSCCAVCERSTKNRRPTHCHRAP